MRYGGGGGYCHIFDQFLPRLRKLGVGEEEIHTMTVDNPARAFARG
jgi:phosphotriesterase-related protein